MQACASGGIVIVLLDRAGHFQARVEGPVSGNVLLRRQQYRISERPDEIVRGFVSGKIANQRAVLQRALRDHGDETAAEVRTSLAAAIGWTISFAASASETTALMFCAAPRERRRSSISAYSIISFDLPTASSHSAGGRDDLRSTRSTLCCHSSIRC
jgi:hypothetical protein